MVGKAAVVPGGVREVPGEVVGTAWGRLCTRTGMVHPPPGITLPGILNHLDPPGPTLTGYQVPVPYPRSR